AEPARRLDGVTNQRCADPAVTAIRGNRHRAEEEGGQSGTTRNGPKARSTDDMIAVSGNECESIRRILSVAQALRALAPTASAERLVEQRLARRGIGRPFFSDRDHLNPLLPLARAVACSKGVDIGKGRSRRGRLRLCQM